MGALSPPGERTPKNIATVHMGLTFMISHSALVAVVIQCVADYEDAFRRALGAKRSKERTFCQEENLAEI